MPWLETDPMNERKRFILEATGGLFSHSELCLRHGISRKTGYKWLDRYETEGPDGLGDRSRRPARHPHTTEPHVLEAAFELRTRRPRWGADKIRAPLSANVRETRSTQRIRVGRKQRKRTCWDCEREWKRMVVPLEPGRPSEARQLLRTQR